MLEEERQQREWLTGCCCINVPLDIFLRKIDHVGREQGLAVLLEVLLVGIEHCRTRSVTRDKQKTGLLGSRLRGRGRFRRKVNSQRDQLTAVEPRKQLLSTVISVQHNWDSVGGCDRSNVCGGIERQLSSPSTTRRLFPSSTHSGRRQWHRQWHQPGRRRSRHPCRQSRRHLLGWFACYQEKISDLVHQGNYSVVRGRKGGGVE